MRQLRPLLLLFFISSMSQAQDVPWGSLTLSEPMDIHRRTALEKLVGFEEKLGNIILLKHNEWKEDLYLEEYSTELELLNRESIELQRGKLGLVYRDMILFQNRIILLTSSYNRKEKAEYFYWQEYDVNTLKPAGELEVFDKAPLPKGPKVMFINPFLGPTERQRKIYSGYIAISDLNFVLTEDAGKMMILRFTTGSPKQRLRFKVMVWDEDFNVILDESPGIDYSLEQFTPKSARLNNDGSFIIVGTKDEDEHVVLGFDRDGEEVFETSLYLDDIKLSNVRYFYMNDTLAFTGFYGKKDEEMILNMEREHGADGMFFGYINTSTGEIEGDISFHAFDFEILTGDLKERKAERVKKKGKEVELFNYYIDHLLPAGNGEFYMTSEFYTLHISSQTNYNANGTTTTSTTYHYTYGDILVARISASGQVKWISRLEKRQYTTDDGGRYSSYLARVYNGHLYILYNTRGEEKPDKKFTIFSDPMGSMSIIARIDPAGGIATDIFHDREAGYVRFVPSACDDYDYNKFYLWGHRFKKEVMGIYTITD